MSHIKASIYLYCMTLTGILEPLPALGSMTENFIVHPSVVLMCSYLNVSVVSRLVNAQKAMKAGSETLSRQSTACNTDGTHWHTFVPQAFLLSFIVAIL